MIAQTNSTKTKVNYILVALNTSPKVKTTPMSQVYYAQKILVCVSD